MTLAPLYAADQRRARLADAVPILPVQLSRSLGLINDLIDTHG